jgi:hypothetical protein
MHILKFLRLEPFLADVAHLNILFQRPHLEVGYFQDLTVFDAPHFFFQLLHFVQVGDLVLQFQVIFAIFLERDETYEKRDAEYDREYGEYLVAGTHEKIIDRVEENREGKSRYEVFHGIIPGNRVDVDEREFLEPLEELGGFRYFQVVDELEFHEQRFSKVVPDDGGEENVRKRRNDRTYQGNRENIGVRVPVQEVNVGAGFEKRESDGHVGDGENAGDDALEKAQPVGNRFEKIEFAEFFQCRGDNEGEKQREQPHAANPYAAGIEARFHALHEIVHFQVSLHEKEIDVDFLAERNVHRLEYPQQKTPSENEEEDLLVREALEKKNQSYERYQKDNVGQNGIHCRYSVELVGFVRESVEFFNDFFHVFRVGSGSGRCYDIVGCHNGNRIGFFHLREKEPGCASGQDGSDKYDDEFVFEEFHKGMG